MHPMKILLIEDDILPSTVLAELLTANHNAIDLANNGQTGLDLAMSAEYDLILLDWLIPKLDGISLCRQLRSQGYNKPILLLSAKNCNADIVAGLDAKADDYAIKLTRSSLTPRKLAPQFTIQASEFILEVIIRNYVDTRRVAS